MSAAYLGLDAGTSGVKVVIVDDEGATVAAAESPLAVSSPRPGWSEQDPAEWWSGAILAVRAALASSPRGLEVAAVGLSGQMHSAVVLDESDTVIRPAILWNDVRTTSQCREIERRVGVEGLRELVGNRALEGFTAPKLLWLRDHEPASHGRIRTVLLPKDYVRLRMTGERATEPSDAAGTLLFDIAGSRWSAAMLAALEVDERWLPRVADSAGISGRVTVEAAGELGLPAGTPVVGGGADNAAAAVGAGLTGSGRGSVSIGTSGAVVAPADSAAVDAEMRLHTFNHAVAGMWYTMGVVLSAGSALAWWRSVLAGGGAAMAYDELIEDALAVRPGCEGLRFLPYLSGERTPHADSSSRGVFFGLHSGHTRAHMVRAVLEGVTFALLDSLGLMRELGTAPLELVAVGGGTRSRGWRQMLADAFGVPVLSLRSAGGAPMGAAMLAACGAGRFRDAEEAARAWVHDVDRLAPERDRAAAYAEAYAGYRALYPALRERFAEEAGRQGGEGARSGG